MSVSDLLNFYAWANYAALGPYNADMTPIFSDPQIFRRWETFGDPDDSKYLLRKEAAENFLEMGCPLIAGNCEINKPRAMKRYKDCLKND